MKKRRLIPLFTVLLGLILGLAVPSAPAAAGPRSVVPGATRVTVDGRPVSVDGYNLNNGSNYFKLRDLTQSLDVAMEWDAGSNSANLNTSSHYKNGSASLITGSWAPDARARLETLIRDNANQSRHACFDFDNTSSIYDIGNALFAYQILNLRFAMKPAEFQDVLDTGLPDLNCEVGKI